MTGLNVSLLFLAKVTLLHGHGVIHKQPKPMAEAVYLFLSFPQFTGTLIFFQCNNRICHRMRLLPLFIAQKICNPLFLQAKFLGFGFGLVFAYKHSK